MTSTDRRKRILNTSEKAVNEIITVAALHHGAKVSVKLRIADVLDINNSGLSNSTYGYALKAHFDYVVTQNDVAEFCVEFDGPGHDARNDDLKNAISNRFGLPLFRVQLLHLNAKPIDVTFIAWMVHNWFGFKAFQEAQRTGEIDVNEPYDLGNFLTFPGFQKHFPFEFANRIAERINTLMKDHYWFLNTFYEQGAAHIRLRVRFFTNRENKTQACMIFISVPDGNYVCGSASIRMETHGVSASQGPLNTLKSFVEGMAMSDLHDNLVETTAGSGAFIANKAEIEAREQKYLSQGMIEGIVLW
jgi:hypothetical protein